MLERFLEASKLRSKHSNSKVVPINIEIQADAVPGTRNETTPEVEAISPAEPHEMRRKVRRFSQAKWICRGDSSQFRQPWLPDCRRALKKSIKKAKKEALKSGMELTKISGTKFGGLRHVCLSESNAADRGYPILGMIQIQSKVEVEEVEDLEGREMAKAVIIGMSFHSPTGPSSIYCGIDNDMIYFQRYFDNMRDATNPGVVTLKTFKDVEDLKEREKKTLRRSF